MPKAFLHRNIFMCAVKIYNWTYEVTQEYTQGISRENKKEPRQKQI